jgi:small-conductance mechanosensitive channel
VNSVPDHAEYAKAKGSDRIQVNNILSAVCIGVLSVLLTVSPARVGTWVLGQLAIAVPCLITSSLAYSKTAYRPESEYRTWDFLAWITHSVGYLFVLNSVALLAYASNYAVAAWLFIGAAATLFVVYSVIDIALKGRRLKEKVLKLAFYLVLLFVGSVLPILFGLV